MRIVAATVLGAAALLAPLAAQAQADADPSPNPAANPAIVRLTLKDHRFAPDTVVAPAGRPLRIELVNEDAAPEQVESPELGVAEDVTAHGRASLAVGPLQPGRYSLKGQLHADTATGVLQVVAGP